MRHDIDKGNQSQILLCDNLDWGTVSIGTIAQVKEGRRVSWASTVKVEVYISGIYEQSYDRKEVKL